MKHRTVSSHIIPIIGPPPKVNDTVIKKKKATRPNAKDKQQSRMKQHMFWLAPAQEEAGEESEGERYMR